jgi:hypothetical protein
MGVPGDRCPPCWPQLGLGGSISKYTVPGLEIERFYELGTLQSPSDRKFKS